MLLCKSPFAIYDWMICTTFSDIQLSFSNISIILQKILFLLAVDHHPISQCKQLLIYPKLLKSYLLLPSHVCLVIHYVWSSDWPNIVFKATIVLFLDNFPFVFYSQMTFNIYTDYILFVHLFTKMFLFTHFCLLWR